MIYKYYPPTDYTFDALCNRYFFFSKVSKLNDPFDSSFKLIKGTKLANMLIQRSIIHLEAEQIMKEYGTCSFSEVKDSMHMWAFYANNFGGLVVGYDDSKFPSITEKLMARVPYYKVTYLESMNNVDSPYNIYKLKNLISGNKCIKGWEIFKGDPKIDDDFFAYLYTIKAKATWSEEKEHRLFAGNDILRNKTRLEQLGVQYTPTGYKIPMPDGAIKEIIIGHNFPESRYGCIKRIAEENGITSIQHTQIEKPFEIGFGSANL